MLHQFVEIMRLALPAALSSMAVFSQNEKEQFSESNPISISIYLCLVSIITYCTGFSRQKESTLPR